MMVDFDEAYLPFQKFPADANRGVDVFPSEATFTPVIASPSSFETLSSPSITLYSSSLVILPPVPDMSMPFNVISLSCTLWAFVLGSLLNTLVRRGTESVKRELTGEKEKRPIDKLREKIKDKVGKLRGALRRIVGDKATTGESTPSVDTESSSRNE
jgi:phosphatidylinositol glycan class T